MPTFNNFYTDPIDEFTEAMVQDQRRSASRGPGDDDNGGLDLPDVDLPDVPSISEVVSRVYGDVDPLSSSQQQTLSQLQQREQRLQPIEFGQLGSSSIPGNPFSVDTRGLFTGLSNLAEGIINNIRSDRRQEYQQKLQSLQSQRRQNIQAAKGRQQLLSEMLPERAQNLMQQRMNIAEGRRTAKREAALNRQEAGIEATQQQQEFERQKELENLQKENKAYIERLQARLERQTEAAEGNGSGGGGGGIDTSLFNNFMDRASATSNRLYQRARKLQKRKRKMGVAWSKQKQNKVGQRIKDLRQKAAEFESLSTQILETGNLPAAARKFQNLVEGINDGVGALVTPKNRRAMPETPAQKQRFKQNVRQGLQQTGQQSSTQLDPDAIQQYANNNDISVDQARRELQNVINR